MANDRLDAQSVFENAIAIENDHDRLAYLERICRGRPDLRALVDAMLARDAENARKSLEFTPDAMKMTSEISTERSGSVIGPYKLLQQIGEGGFGSVFMAEQTIPIRRKVAVKIIKPGMDSKEVIARFEAERQALALMDHPNIAKVLDGGTTAAGQPYFVMELVRGVSITDYCDANHLSAQARLKLFVSICHAIQHAHQKGVIHRDIKPSNILVTLHDGEPVPKVIDFGVAKAISQELTSKTLFTAYGQMIGTPLYMSPEQAEMSGLDIDTRSDIFSLGVLLYELLTGTTPLDAASLRGIAYGELQRRIREEDPIKPSSRLSSLGDQSAKIATRRGLDSRKLTHFLRGDLDWIVLKALEKNRERRYSTANGMAQDIERFLNREPVEACPPSLAYLASKFAARNRGLLIASSIVGCTLVVATLISSWQAVRATRANHQMHVALTQAREQQAAAKRERDRANRERDRANLESERARSAQATALSEADASKAVLKFLQDDVLGASNRNEEPNRQLTIRDVLDKAAQRIDEHRGELPHHVEAAIRKTLSTCYQSVSAFKLAIPHAMREYELRQKHAQVDDPERIDSIRRLSEALLMDRTDASNYASASSRSKEALIAARQSLPQDHLVRLKCEMNDLTYLSDRLQNSEQIHEHLRSSLRDIEARIQPHLAKPEYGEFGVGVYRALCVAYREHGEHLESRNCIPRALELSLERFGPSHPETFACRWFEVRDLMQSGKYLEAEPLLRELVELERNWFGSEVLEVRLDLGALADLYWRMGRRNDELKCRVKLAEAIDVNFGFSHDAPAAALACQAMGDEATRRRLIAKMLEVPGSALDNKTYVFNVSRAALASDRLEPPDIERIASLLKSHSADNSTLTLTLQGLCAYRKADYETALKLFDDASSKRSAELGPDQNTRILADAFRSMVLFRLNRMEESRQILLDLRYWTGSTRFDIYPHFLPLDDESLPWWLALREANGLIQLSGTSDEQLIDGIIQVYDDYASTHLENVQVSPWQDKLTRRLWLGRADEHLRLCRDRFAQVRDSTLHYEIERCAKTYLIRPDSAGDVDLLNQAVTGAERALSLIEADDEYRGMSPWFSMCLGMARYRQGDWKAADTLLSHNLDDWRSSLRTLSLLFRAMARWQLGRHDDARLDYEAASYAMQIPPENIVGQGAFIHNDVLNCVIVRREAGRLLGMGTSSAKSSPHP